MGSAMGQELPVSAWMNQKGLLGFWARRLLGRINDAMAAAVVWRKFRRDGWVSMGFSFGSGPRMWKRHQTVSIVTAFAVASLPPYLSVGWRVSLGKLPRPFWMKSQCIIEEEGREGKESSSRRCS